MKWLINNLGNIWRLIVFSFFAWLLISLVGDPEWNNLYKFIGLPAGLYFIYRIITADRWMAREKQTEKTKNLFLDLLYSDLPIKKSRLDFFKSEYNKMQGKH